MNNYQNKDSAECLSMADEGKEKDCLGCSCNVCLLDYEERLKNKGKEIIKEIILEDLKIMKNGTNQDYENLDEIHGAKTAIQAMIDLIDKYE